MNEGGSTFTPGPLGRAEEALAFGPEKAASTLYAIVFMVGSTKARRPAADDAADLERAPSGWGALRLAHHLDRLLQQLIAARDHTGEGAADRDGGLDPHSEVGRAVLLPDVHAGPAQRVTAGHVERIHAAVGARGGAAHEGAEPLTLDDPDQALGSAQDPAVDQGRRAVVLPSMPI